MSFEEQQVRQAFEQLRAPQGAIDATLQRIEELRAQEEEAALQGVSQIAGPTAAPAAAPASNKGFRVVRARNRVRNMWLAAACIALALVGVLGVGGKLYFEPTAYVGIDVNPSIELGVNRFDIVVEARDVNEDGRAVLEQMPLLYKSFGEALDLLGNNAAFRTYVDSAAVMEITISSDDEAQTQHLCAQGDRFIEEMPCRGTCSHASGEDRHEAHSHGMGVARYQAAQELLALDPSLTLEDCAAMSMRELRDRIAACGASGSTDGTAEQELDAEAQAADDELAAAGQGAGNHHGQGMGGERHRAGNGRHQ